MIVTKFYFDLDTSQKLKVQASAAWGKMCEGYCYLPGSEKYYNEYHNLSYLVKTFVVFRDEHPLLVFPCTIKENKLSWFQFPACFFSEPCSPGILSEAYIAAFAFLSLMKSQFAINEMFIEFNSFLVAEYFNNISKVENAHSSIIDYSLSNEQIKSSVRKSYKSLINWGQRNLDIVITDKNQPDKLKYTEFKEFHVETAGRKTRSDNSWDLHYKMLLEGNAFLVSAYYEGKIASNVFVLHGSEEAFYGVGVNDRSLMEKKLAISHYPLLTAIYHGRDIGLKYFNMNEVDRKGLDDKADNIAKFKQGFSGMIKNRTSYLFSF